MKRKLKIEHISDILMMVSIMMISTGIFLQNGTDRSLELSKLDAKSVATNLSKAATKDLSLEEVNLETAPASVLRIEVYQGMTMEELSAKLNKSLGGILAGHGNTIAEHSLKVGADPYVVTAIMMHETGNGTSRIANGCYNFGGQKGYGCGAYKRYNSVDEGLTGMIDNLYNNYYAHGLTTVEAIGSRYAESNTWPSMINWYIGQIKAK